MEGVNVITNQEEGQRNAENPTQEEEENEESPQQNEEEEDQSMLQPQIT